MIRVGTAGWDYADWEGIVYPAGAGRRFDRLAFLSRFVDVIEINSTFYRPVAPRVAESWVRRTARRPQFLFTAKAHRSWTHEPDGAVAARDPTLAGLEPLREAGRLGALLLQFPQSVHFAPASRERIARLLERLDGWAPTVEVRHASWESEAAADWLRALGAAWCVVDQPQVGRSTARALPRFTGPPAYLRLHGRNAPDWFREDAGRDARYDYLYDARELLPLAEIAQRLAGEAAELFVIQNNHFRGQALVNALQMKRLLAGDVRPPAPHELVVAYPPLEREVTVERSLLF